MANNQGGSGKFVLGAFIGGLAGAAAALFLAPKSGKELRDDLSEQAMVLKDKTNEYNSIALEKGSEFADYAKRKTISLTQAVSEQSSQVVDKVKTAKEQVLTQADETQEDSDVEENEGVELIEEVSNQDEVATALNEKQNF
ncbi:YtxH domain-containing protein [Bacillus pinisoli]|uniref:YtxH domain-containing protein n=1 Tax=Bacillus pinisoli TaxID=2901866 RepID=UPI001FF17DC1|nr:YtxH domain-containing protein [Bacillus pinisoli]